MFCNRRNDRGLELVWVGLVLTIVYFKVVLARLIIAYRQHGIDNQPNLVFCSLWSDWLFALLL